MGSASNLMPGMRGPAQQRPGVLVPEVMAGNLQYIGGGGASCPDPRPVFSSPAGPQPDRQAGAGVSSQPPAC